MAAEPLASLSFSSPRSTPWSASGEEIARTAIQQDQPGSKPMRNIRRIIPEVDSYPNLALACLSTAGFALRRKSAGATCSPWMSKNRVSPSLHRSWPDTKHCISAASKVRTGCLWGGSRYAARRGLSSDSRRSNAPCCCSAFQRLDRTASSWRFPGCIDTRRNGDSLTSPPARPGCSTHRH